MRKLFKSKRILFLIVVGLALTAVVYYVATDDRSNPDIYAIYFQDSS